MGFFSTLFEPIENLLHFVLSILYNLSAAVGFPSYGVAIILLTIVIKMILYPLTVKQVKSMKAMQELQPKMKAIQDKYKSNPQVMQQKIGELYKEAGVNPLAGCLPLLVQMPILMGMYYSLYSFDYAGGSAAFLWLNSLSEPDHMYILPVLSALTTYLQQKQTTSDSNTQMKAMMVVMPLFIGWISLNFPSGLVLYWVTMNVVQIAQQWWMYRGQNGEPKKEAA